MSDSPLAVSKERLPISKLWQIRNWPGTPGRECLVPYRPEDRRKSGSVFVATTGKDRGLEIFKDFKSGEPPMDAPKLLALVEGLANGEACKQFIELAGGPVGKPTFARRVWPNPRKDESRPRSKPVMPKHWMPSVDETESVAVTRQVSPEAVELAVSEGSLVCCRHHGHACWAILDRSRRNVQLRRVDGRTFLHGRGAKKTLCLRGSQASWPIGASSQARREMLMVVEGSGDYLAAFEFIVRESYPSTGVVAITGASNWIPKDALQFFRDRRVRIFPHIDTSGAGEQGGLRWETQLASVAASVRCFGLRGLRTTSGEAVEDLNDVLKMDSQEIIALGPIAQF